MVYLMVVSIIFNIIENRSPINLLCLHMYIFKKLEYAIYINIFVYIHMYRNNALYLNLKPISENRYS